MNQDNKISSVRPCTINIELGVDLHVLVYGWTSLTASLSCINSRLVWYFERHNFITPAQSGFRKQRSKTDHLVRLELFVREAFVQRQHAVAIFFDLEKAYEKNTEVWHNEGFTQCRTPWQTTVLHRRFF